MPAWKTCFFAWTCAFVCACSSGKSGTRDPSGGASGKSAVHDGSSGAGGAHAAGAHDAGGSGASADAGQDSGGTMSSSGHGACTQEGADCSRSTTACCDGLLCSDVEHTCLIECTQAGACVSAFNAGRPGAKGQCCATTAHDPADASSKGLVCGARCMDSGGSSGGSGGGSSDGGACIAEGMGCGLASGAASCCDGLDCSSQEGKCGQICKTDDDCPHTPLYLLCQGSGGPKHVSVCIFSNGAGTP